MALLDILDCTIDDLIEPAASPARLTRKMDLSWRAAATPAVTGRSGVCRALWVRRPVWCLVRLVRVRDAAEGDVEAEGAELADVVADLPADLSAALIVVRPRSSYRMPGWIAACSRRSAGCCRGDQGFGFAAAAGQAPVAGALAGLVLPAATAVSPSRPPRYRLPFLDLAFPCVCRRSCPAGCARPEARCAPVRNRVMSVPVSATASWAARRPSRASIRLLQLLLIRFQQSLDHLR